jgi:hypothetical protein
MVGTEAVHIARHDAARRLGQNRDSVLPGKRPWHSSPWCGAARSTGINWRRRFPLAQLNYCGGACNETDPFVWLDKFFAACSGCQVDYIAMHWYACSRDALVWYLGKYKAKYAQPLWLADFACLDDAILSDAKEAQYMQDALGVLEADPAIFRYSWFTGRFPSQPVANLLAAPAGTLTPLGKACVDHPAGP